jgi:hypothetical protein
LTLVLFVLNPTLVSVGTQVRGYALGCALGLVISGFFARVAVRPVPLRTWIGLTIAQVLGVQAMYANVPIVAAGSFAAMVCVLAQRRFRAAGGLVVAAVVSASSTLPYLFVAFPSMNEWAVLVKLPDIGLRILVLSGTFIIPHSVVTPILVLFLALVVFEFVAGGKLLPSAGRSLSRRDLTRLFAVLFACGAWALIVGYVIFLKVPTANRYFLPLVLVTTFAIDHFRSLRPLGPWSARLRPAVVVAAAVLAISIAPIAFTRGWGRVSNVDWAARLVDGALQPGDQVIVHPWYLGTSYLRYARHRDEAVLLPEMTISEIPKGYLKILNMIRTDTPLHPDWSDLRDRIARGKAVWVVARPAWPRDVVVTREGLVQIGPWWLTTAGVIEVLNGAQLAEALERSGANLTRHVDPNAASVMGDETVEVFEFRKP